MINFSGLASGLDTASIISQLVSLERQQATVLGSRKRQEETAKGVVNEMVGKLKALETEAGKLDAATEIGATQITSSNEDLVKATSSNAATPGTYSLTVDALARTETTASNAQVGSAGPGVAGTIDITVGTDATVQVPYSDTNSLFDIATAINDSDAAVQASVLDLGGGQFRLMINSERSGSAGAMTFSETGGNLGLADVANEVVTARDAQVTMNGVTVTRSNNVISDLLPGVTLNLRGETGTNPPTEIVVERDTEGTSEQLQSLVDAFNEVVKAVNGQLTFTGAEGKQSPLFGDGTIRRLQRDMGTLATTSHAHNGGTVSIGAVGMKLDRSGTLSVDSVALGKMLETDPEALRNLLIGEDGKSGMVAALKSTVTNYTRSGDGVLEAKKTALDSRISDYDKMITAINDRADSLGSRLTQQFAALEQTMLELQSQQDALSSLFISLNAQ